jgi:hypothetical protein
VKSGWKSRASKLASLNAETARVQAQTAALKSQLAKQSDGSALSELKQRAERYLRSSSHGTIASTLAALRLDEGTVKLIAQLKLDAAALTALVREVDASLAGDRASYREGTGREFPTAAKSAASILTADEISKAIDFTGANDVYPGRGTATAAEQDREASRLVVQIVDELMVIARSLRARFPGVITLAVASRTVAIGLHRDDIKRAWNLAARMSGRRVSAAALAQRIASRLDAEAKSA